jgi:hypothetical protein
MMSDHDFHSIKPQMTNYFATSFVPDNVRKSIQKTYENMRSEREGKIDDSKSPSEEKIVCQFCKREVPLSKSRTTKLWSSKRHQRVCLDCFSMMN